MRFARKRRAMTGRAAKRVSQAAMAGSRTHPMTSMAIMEAGEGLKMGNVNTKVTNGVSKTKTAYGCATGAWHEGRE